MHADANTLTPTAGGHRPDASHVLPDDERLRQGAELLTANRVVEAFRVFAGILRSEPTSVGPLVGAAHCALAVDDTRNAHELLRRALKAGNPARFLRRIE